MGCGGGGGGGGGGGFLSHECTGLNGTGFTLKGPLRLWGLLALNWKTGLDFVTTTATWISGKRRTRLLQHFEVLHF